MAKTNNTKLSDFFDEMKKIPVLRGLFFTKAEVKQIEYDRKYGAGSKRTFDHLG